MKTMAIVPIKLGNERLLGKNTKCLGGKPLILYCLETLLTVREIDNVFVYCSSEEITEYLLDGVSYLKRPKELDLPTANFTQICESFISKIDADIYVYAHATAPFISAETIRREIEAVSIGQHDSAFCAERIQDFLWQGGKAMNFDPSNVPRSQDLPVVYRETSGVYVFKKSVFTTRRMRVGVNPYIAEVGRREAIDINTEEDFVFAEHMIHYGERI
jgi:CMP-N-acetylneuraminic acid synthetase